MTSWEVGIILISSIIMMIIIICSGDGRDSGWMIRSRQDNMGCWQTLVRCQRDIGARNAEVGKAISSAVVNVIAMTSIIIIMKANSAGERVVT